MGGIFRLISCLVVTLTATSWAASPTERIELAKADLNAEFGFPADRELCILTVTRTPVYDGMVSLISHREFEQLLRLLYASTVHPGNFFYRWLVGEDAADAPPYSNSREVELNNFLDMSLAGGLPEKDLVAIDRTRRNLGRYFTANNLKDKCKIVVFNEMFFSQMQPLTSVQKDFIQEKLLALSRQAYGAIFYPNFLYTEQRKVSGESIHRMFNQMNSNLSSTATVNQQDLEECQSIITEQVRNDATEYDWDFLINETLSVSRTRALTKYRKVGYFFESDECIGSGALYDSGPGYDEAIGETSSLQRILLRDFTTDICLDLNIGVRQRSANHWTNPLEGQSRDSCLHIVQANSIDPFLNSINRSNLPLNRGIIHADKYPHPSWITPESGRPQNIFLPYRVNDRIVDNLVRYKEDSCVRFGNNDYKFSFLHV